LGRKKKSGNHQSQQKTPLGGKKEHIIPGKHAVPIENKPPTERRERGQTPLKKKNEEERRGVRNGFYTPGSKGGEERRGNTEGEPGQGEPWGTKAPNQKKKSCSTANGSWESRGLGEVRKLGELMKGGWLKKCCGGAKFS